MNALVENGIISEMECGNNFAYIINDSMLGVDFAEQTSMKKLAYLLD